MSLEATIADRLQALIGRREILMNQLTNWWNGTVNGGPNNDGMYPFTDDSGTTVMKPSPDLITQQAGFSSIFVYPDEFDPLAASGPSHDDTACLQAMFNSQLTTKRQPALRNNKTYYLRGKLVSDPSRNSLEGNNAILNWSQRSNFIDPASLPDLTGTTGRMNSSAGWTSSANETAIVTFSNGSMISTPPEGENRYLERGFAISAPAGSVIKVTVKIDYITPHTVGQNTFRDFGISFRRNNGNIAASIGGGGNVGGTTWFYSSNQGNYAPGVTVDQTFTITEVNPVFRIQSNAELSIADIEIKVLPDNVCWLFETAAIGAGGQLRGHNYRNWSNFKCVGRPGLPDAAFVEMMLHNTPTRDASDSGFHTRVNMYNVDISDGIGYGITFGDRSYLSNFFGCRIVTAKACIRSRENTHDAGENIAFFGGNIGGGEIGVYNPGNMEIHMFGTSIDFSRQWYVGGSGFVLNGCHLETNQSTQVGPLIDVLGGHVEIRNTKLQVNGSTVPLVDNVFRVAKLGFLDIESETPYNLHSLSGALCGGEGRFRFVGRGGSDKQIDAIAKRDAMHNILGAGGYGDYGLAGYSIWANVLAGQERIDRWNVSFPTSGQFAGNVTLGSDIITDIYSPTTGLPIQLTNAQVGATITNPETDAGTIIVESISGGTFTGNISLGSSVITNVFPAPTAAAVNGRYVVGPGIPVGTRVIAYSNASSTVTLSRGATATTTGITVNAGNQGRLSKPWTGPTGTATIVHKKVGAVKAGVELGTGGKSSDPCLHFYRSGISNANLTYAIALRCEPDRAYGTELSYKVSPDATAPDATTTQAFYLQVMFARIQQVDGAAPVIVRTQFISDLPQTGLMRQAGTDWTTVRASTQRIDVTTEHDGYAPAWATHVIWTINLAGTPGAFDLRIDDVHGNPL